MTTDDWAALLDYWRATGHDPQFLDIPPDVATQLGLTPTTQHETSPERRETNMQQLPHDPNEHTPTDAVPNNTTPSAPYPDPPKWKRKSYFDGTECGYSGCSKPAEGYVSGTKPTKGGTQSSLWYGPACTACVRKRHDSLVPTTLAQLAQQRNGASDLALVLDVEVGDVLKRLVAAGIDEKGRLLQHIQPRQQPSDQQQMAPLNTVNGVASTDLAVFTPDTLAAAPIQIPRALLVERFVYAQSILQQLSAFHIRDQAAMDYTSNFLADAKGMWKTLEENRKELGRPFREALQIIQDHFQPPLKLLKDVEVVLKQKIAEGHAHAQAAQAEAFRLAQAALQQGNIPQAALATQQAVAADVTLSQGVRMTTKLQWEWDNTAPLPPEFWSWVPDPNKVQAAIDAGYRQIPGVRIFEVPTVASVST